MSNVFSFDSEDDFNDDTVIEVNDKPAQRRTAQPTTHAEAEHQAQQYKRNSAALATPIERRNRELMALATGIELYAPRMLKERASMLMGSLDLDPCNTWLGNMGDRSWQQGGWWGYHWNLRPEQPDEPTFTDDSGAMWTNNQVVSCVSKSTPGYVYELQQSDGLGQQWKGNVWLFPPKGPIEKFKPELSGQFKRIEQVWWQALLSHVELGNVPRACYLCEDLRDLTHDMLRFPLVFFKHEVDYEQPVDTCCGKALPETELQMAPKRGRRSVLVYVTGKGQGTALSQSAELTKHFGDMGKVMVPA